MISEVFPSLFLLQAAKPAAKRRYTYLLRRREGNILLATKDDALPHAADLDALGGVQHVLLGDRHHALPATAAFARRCGTVLAASGMEAKALAAAGVKVGRILEFERHAFASDLENPADARAYARRIVVSVDAWWPSIPVHRRYAGTRRWRLAILGDDT